MIIKIKLISGDLIDLKNLNDSKEEDDIYYKI